MKKGKMKLLAVLALVILTNILLFVMSTILVQLRIAKVNTKTPTTFFSTWLMRAR